MHIQQSTNNQPVTEYSCETLHAAMSVVLSARHQRTSAQHNCWEHCLLPRALVFSIPQQCTLGGTKLAWFVCHIVVYVFVCVCGMLALA